MATVDFPSSPVLNQTYVFNNRTWFWDGSGWERFFPSGAPGAPFTLLSGPFMTALVTGFTENFSGPTDNFTLLTHI
jgi:hypothetical protein